MKKRTIHATQILAVALTSLAGCAEGPTATRATAEASTAQAPPPAPAPTATPVATAPPVVTPPPVPVAPPERPLSTDPKLLALAGELRGKLREHALANVPRYRPLCDADGYPLVGNLVQGKGDVGPQPSELCAVVRQKKGTR